jgi:hypothetical protein
VNAAAVESAAAPPAASPAPAPNVPPEVDAKGTPFDPERHNRTKHPKTGVWMPRRKPAASASHPSGASYVAPDAPPPPPPEPLSEYRVAAEAACAVTFTVGMTLGGEEWQPSKDEHATLAQAFEAYFRAKGCVDVPPGVALTIALLSYAGPRFTKPKTQGRLQKLRMWWAQKRAERRGAHAAEVLRKTAPPAGEPATS